MMFKWSLLYCHLIVRPFLPFLLFADLITDVRVIGFWGRCQGVFFDARIFHPNVPSCLGTHLFRWHELEKK